MLKKFIPAFEWIPNYQRKDLSGDMSAGLIVAIMLIPQGMAYAMLAGLPPVIGLYASTIPLLIYALFGTSRQLAVGPVAMDSLLVFAGVSVIATPGSTEYISLVLLLMLMVGVIQLLLGLFRLGFLVNFLSHAVITGFTSAAAIIIALSQLKHLLGIKLESNNQVLSILWETMFRLTEINLYVLAIGIGSIGALIILKRMAPKLPAPLLVVVLSIVVVSFFNLNEKGVAIVGEVPKGLPSLSIPIISIDSIITLLPIAITISFIAFMEAIAMAKAIATKEKYKVIPNQELRALGLANIGGSFFSGYPVTGGLSRSAVNYQSGAKTQLASIITAGLILLILLFFTGGFYYLPNTVLAAIIMVAVFSLVNISEAKRLFNIRKLDGWTWVITFLATILVGIVEGILIGAAFSLILFIFRSAYPHIAELGYLRDERVYRNIKRYPHAEVRPDVLIYRIDASLYFANTTFIEDRLYERLSGDSLIKYVILDFTGVNSIDAVAVHALEEMMESYEQVGIKFVYSGVKGPVSDIFNKAHWYEKYEERFFLNIESAIESIQE